MRLPPTSRGVGTLEARRVQRGAVTLESVEGCSQPLSAAAPNDLPLSKRCAHVRAACARVYCMPAEPPSTRYVSELYRLQGWLRSRPDVTVAIAFSALSGLLLIFWRSLPYASLSPLPLPVRALALRRIIAAGLW